MKKSAARLIRVATACLLWRAAVGSASAATLATGDFLNFPVDVRSLGMGEAAQASAQGAAGVNVNPAALLDVRAQEAYFTHAFLVAGVGFDYFGYAVRYRQQRFGLDYHHVGYGSLDGRDNAGNQIGGFGPNDTAYGLSYGTTIAGRVDVGARWRYITSSLVNTANTSTMDLGARCQVSDDLTVALSVSNLFGSLKFENESEPLPAAAKGGVAWRPLKTLLLGFDVVSPVYAPAHVAFGTEYALAVQDANQLFFRAGFDTSSPDTGGLAGFKAGFGFAWRPLSIDYAFSPMGDLGSEHHLGMSYRFGDDLRAADAAHP